MLIKTMHSILPIMECRCGGKFNESSKKVVCVECGSDFDIVENDSCVIIEEVYKAEKKSPSPLLFSQKVLKKKGNWRLQNYKISEKWVNKFSQDDLIVDLGCGRLINYELLKDKNAIYIDGAYFEKINIVCDFTKKIPLKNNSVDAILCSNVFEHLPKPQVCFDEIFRVLKPGGDCLILVPFVIKLHQEPFDFHRYTKHALKTYAMKAGFKSIDVQEVGGMSNILGTILTLAIKDASNIFIKSGLRLQYLIWKILRKFFDDGPPNKILPQGYTVYLKK